MSPNRSAIIMVLLIGFVFLFVGCGSNDVEKAKEFMAAGMYPQAIELLNKRIQEKPDDAEAHFQLGVCLINTGSFRMADERFASAVRLKPDYGFQIGGEYKIAGMQALGKSDFSNAQNLFDKAVSFQPDLKDEIVKFCVEKGTALLNSGTTQNTDSGISETGKATKCFDIAFSACPECGTKIAAILDKEFDKNSDPELLKKAIGYASKTSSPDAISLQKNLFQKLKETTSLPEIRKLVAKFGANLSQAEQEEIAPPPTWQDVPGSVKTIDDPRLHTADGAPIIFPLTEVGDQAGFTGESFEVKLYEPKLGKDIWVSYQNEFFSKTINTQPRTCPRYVRSLNGNPVKQKLRRFQ